MPKLQYRSIGFESDTLYVIDQKILPHKFEVIGLEDSVQVTEAIKDMTVRGAGVIGNVGAFGAYYCAREANGDAEKFKALIEPLRDARPTAVNLVWAVDRVYAYASRAESAEQMADLAKFEALRIGDEELQGSERIAKNGFEIIKQICEKKGSKSINILTHCNAGWLAIIHKGSALAPIYEAQEQGYDVHVWVDETRPRNQGANLTAWELSESGVKHTVIADNTGGILMQKGMVDMCITGADRVSGCGDVANKIGTYLKALAAKDNGVPFYVALPASTFDMNICDGVKEIEIEERSQDEVRTIMGADAKGDIQTVRLVPKDSPALNYGFDVTPARLVSGLITEKGVCEANKESIEKLMGC